MCTRNLKSDCFSKNLMEILLFEQKSRTPFWRVIYPSPSLSQQKNRNILHTNKFADTAIHNFSKYINLHFFNGRKGKNSSVCVPKG